ncbi:MAG TPA: DUF2970 domain-containing protein [Spongiibacteraceae bacterium]|nr:DUF2970 domain-containing protein [Spongiibacteraceae bacterium]
MNVRTQSAPSKEQQQSLTFLQMVGSICASFFGVQSSKNRERDFQMGKPLAFFLVGVLMTVVWYGAIALVVHFVAP